LKLIKFIINAQFILVATKSVTELVMNIEVAIKIVFINYISGVEWVPNHDDPEREVVVYIRQCSRIPWTFNGK